MIHVIEKVNNLSLFYKYVIQRRLIVYIATGKGY